MDTLMLATIAKFVNDFVFDCLAWRKWTLPPRLAHVLVAGTTTLVVYAFDLYKGLPFDVAETVQASLAAVGVDQLGNAFSKDRAAPIVAQTEPTLDRK